MNLLALACIVSVWGGVLCRHEDASGMAVDDCTNGDVSGQCLDQAAMLQNRLDKSMMHQTAFRSVPNSVVHPNPVVLTLACTYKKPQMASFLASLRASGYKGAVIIGIDVDDADHATKQFLEMHNVKTDAAPCIEQEQKQLLGEEQTQWLTDLVFTRYKYYRKWIRGGNYSHAWMLGVKDVFFQADPFLAATPALGFYSMSEYVPEYSLDQIKRCFGPSEMRGVEDQAASSGKANMCGDTIVGDADRVLKMCDDMVAMYSKLKSRDGCILANEQPMLNTLIWSYGDEYVTRHGAFEGIAISTWSSRDQQDQSNGAHGPLWCDSSGIFRESSGKVVNKAGEVVPILHQWMTCPKIRNSIAAFMSARGFRQDWDNGSYRFIQDTQNASIQASP